MANPSAPIAGLDKKLEAAGLPAMVPASSLDKKNPEPGPEPTPDPPEPEPFVAPNGAHQIWAALANAKRDIRAVGKDGKYEQGNTKYNFRGVDAVVNAVSPALARWGITLGFEVEWLKREKFQTKSGGDSWHVTARVEYRFIALDGSEHRVTVEAEANDTADKGTGKVMSVAYRIMLLQVFSIPTDDIDPDAERIELGDAKGAGFSPAIAAWVRHRVTNAGHKAALDALWTLVQAAGAQTHLVPNTIGVTWGQAFQDRLETLEKIKRDDAPPAQDGPSGGPNG